MAAVNAVAAYRQFLIDSGGTAPISKSLTTPPASAVENASTIIPSKSSLPRIAASAPSIPNKNVPAKSAASSTFAEAYFTPASPSFTCLSSCGTGSCTTLGRAMPSYNQVAGQPVERLAALGDGCSPWPRRSCFLELHSPAREAIRNEGDRGSAISRRPRMKIDRQDSPGGHSAALLALA